MSKSNRTLPRGKWTGPRVFTAEELYNADLPTKRWIVELLISVGVITINAKQKTGKSWLTLDLAHGVATGGTVLGAFRCRRRGHVLLLAQEDHPARIRERLRRLYPSGGVPAEIHIITEPWLRMDEGGLGQLEEYLKEYPKTLLVIIDVWRRVKPSAGYNNEIAALEHLHRFAMTHKIAVVLVHHLTKQPKTDIFDEILGPSGFATTADTNIVIKRARASNIGEMWIVGRDVEERALSVKFENCRWTVMGELDEDAASTPDRQEILDTIKAAGRPLSIPEIQSGLKARGIEKTQSAIRFLLTKMVQADEIFRVDRGLYLDRPSSGASSDTTNANETPVSNVSDVSGMGRPGENANNANDANKSDRLLEEAGANRRSESKKFKRVWAKYERLLAMCLNDDERQAIKGQRAEELAAMGVFRS